MSLCREWSLVKHLDAYRYIKPLRCRSWTCEECAPLRKKRLMALAASGDPIRFLTLTVNPHREGTPETRLLELANAWRLTVKRLRRLHPHEPIEYLAIVEETKNHEPHLHILLRSPFIHQHYLSDCMSELIEAPIVDIRRIRNPREVIRYVAKYVTKAPARIGTCKRYWASQGYELEKDQAPLLDPSIGPGWKLDRRPLCIIISSWLDESYQVRQHTPEVLIGTYLPNAWDRHPRL